MSSNLCLDLKDGPIPPDAIILRGYVGFPDVPPQIAHLEALGPNPLLPAGTAAAVKKAFQDAGLETRRIYLSPRLDCYVDYYKGDQLRSVEPEPKDDSFIVWLRPRPTDNPYRVITVSPLTAENGFVRGELVDDFMNQPEAHIVWDEQNYAPNAGKTSGTRCFN